jgi:peptidoglycan/LPS O-acetylase OafA/YrhL
VPLEAMRGIAAAVVVLYHVILAFTPKGVTTMPHGPGLFVLVVQFLLGLVNGSAAVAVFFVLSGFLTSLPFARDRSAARIASSLLKRWPRLAGLTMVGCLISWLLVTVFGDVYKAAGAVIGSNWMTTHANGPLEGHAFTPLAALWQGAVPAFTTGDVWFDPPLWTMRIELFCSLAAYLAAPLLFAVRRWDLRIALALLGMVLSGVGYPLTYFTDFLFGGLLAMAYTEGRFPRLGNAQAALLGVLALYLFSFTYQQVLLIHAPIKAIIPHGDTSHYVWDIATGLAMLVLLGHPPTTRLCSGGWAAWAGRFSFPVYLLHVPLLLSVGALTFLTLHASLGAFPSIAIAASLSVGLSILIAWPLIWVDKAWTKQVNRAVGVVVKVQR